ATGPADPLRTWTGGGAERGSLPRVVSIAREVSMIGPQHLNVPLPDPMMIAPAMPEPAPVSPPAPSMPSAPQDRPSGVQVALSLAPILLAIGQAAGGSPTAGAATLHGYQTGRQFEDERQ